MHQDVECVIDDVRVCRSEVLEEIEIWPALVIDGYDLAVDHRLVGQVFKCMNNRAELRVEDLGAT